jgi:uncharacterized membrane protein YqjE
MGTAAESQEGLAALGREVAQDAVRLVRAEIDLARTQLIDAVKRLLFAIVFAVVAAVLLLIGIIEALGAIPSQFGPDLFHNRWLGWIALGAILALLAALFGVLAFRRFKRSLTEGKQTVDALKEDSEWLRQLTKRKDNGNSASKP